MAILRAQELNRLLGGAVFLPWTLNELPFDWADALTGLAEDLPGQVEVWRKVEAAKAKLRARK